MGLAWTSLGRWPLHSASFNHATCSFCLSLSCTNGFLHHNCIFCWYQWIENNWNEWDNFWMRPRQTDWLTIVCSIYHHHHHFYWLTFQKWAIISRLIVFTDKFDQCLYRCQNASAIVLFKNVLSWLTDLLGTLSKDDEDGSENVGKKKWICVLSNWIASIWTRSICQIQATFPGVKFLRILFRFKKMNENSSSYIHVLHKSSN